MAASRAEEIVLEAVRSDLTPEPCATQSLRRPLVRLLPRAAASQANWRALPRPAVSALFLHLPVLDLFRLGHLFTPRWLEVWRGDPFEVHDAQFARLPIPRSRVADAIGTVLDMYLAAAEEDEDVEGGTYGAVGHGRVKSFRVESTEWRAEHAARWCAALQRGGAFEVVLFNRGFSGDPPVLAPVPRGLRECVSLRVLHLGFFTVEAGELDALARAIQLGLHGCACRPGVVEGVVAGCRQLEKLWVHDGSLEHVAVRSSPQLWRLSMLRTASRSLTVDDAPLLQVIFPGSAATLRISRLPMLRRLLCLDLANTSLEIKGDQVDSRPPPRIGCWQVPDYRQQDVRPKMRSVVMLRLIVDYAELGAMTPLAVEETLRRFPRVSSLFIQRKKDVTEAEGLASITDPHYLDLFRGVECVGRTLQCITLLNFQGGKIEMALAKAILATAKALGTIVLTHDDDRPGIADALLEADQALDQSPRNCNNPLLPLRIVHQTMSGFEYNARLG
ncbi:uncharacterized protein LOC104584836 [Brachypodium distachyon]|uniref:F-box/LRR-repeat protein 15/At3g58940/PEG3-like LRR domain-containing protein n=1 Tax=Brachypodium distachyon TaxID=15368 RepID=I1IGV6_BRADI|nr:uncharacterized protein LOC104584836 [Brachypodium distachyon]KQJ86010.1 hypothetical protein BRADI_4g02860v3 [Brachypodium distachyon]|eukprot:XP_014757537.1 uncharacterized protein LOC104584836 [Brachypodium distachyon]